MAVGHTDRGSLRELALESAVADVIPRWAGADADGHLRDLHLKGSGRSQISLNLKLELLQHTGSFKPRGAFNRVLSTRPPSSGLIAASGGNHGLAVAHVAHVLGLAAEVFVPTSSSPVKVNGLRRHGAIVTVGGDYYADAWAASQERAHATGALTVHAYDGFDTVAGQGTVACELDERLPDIDTVLVAVGGGGLIGGIASWYAGHESGCGGTGTHTHVSQPR